MPLQEPMEKLDLEDFKQKLPDQLKLAVVM
jgi:hypothetical protein